MGLWNLLDHIIATKKEVESLRMDIAKRGAKEEDTKRRMDAIEKGLSDANARAWDAHKTFITVIFAAITIGVGIAGWISFQTSSRSPVLDT